MARGGDIGAARLLELGLEQSGRADAAAFIRNGLSLSEAARALDLSRRTVAYYASVRATYLIRCS